MKNQNLGSALSREELKSIRGGAGSKRNAPSMPMASGMAIGTSMEFNSCYACCWYDEPDNCSRSIEVPADSTCVNGAFITPMECSE